MKPSIGRIVHYRGCEGDDLVPAIITKVHSETCVDVVKFGAGGHACIGQTSVTQGDLETGTSCWNWPARVE